MLHNDMVWLLSVSSVKVGVARHVSMDGVIE